MDKSPTPAHEPARQLPRLRILLDHAEAPSRRRLLAWRTRARVLEWLEVNSVPFLVLGAAVNTVLLIRTPNLLALLFEILYGLLILWKIIQMITRRTGAGTVVDAETGAPLGLALVRVATARRFVQVRATDAQGRFFLLLQPGAYTLEVSHPGHETESRLYVVPRGRGVAPLARTVRLRKVGGT